MRRWQVCAVGEAMGEFWVTTHGEGTTKNNSPLVPQGPADLAHFSLQLMDKTGRPVMEPYVAPVPWCYGGERPHAAAMFASLYKTSPIQGLSSLLNPFKECSSLQNCFDPSFDLGQISETNHHHHPLMQERKRKQFSDINVYDGAILS